MRLRKQGAKANKFDAEAAGKKAKTSEPVPSNEEEGRGDRVKVVLLKVSGKLAGWC